MSLRQNSLVLKIELLIKRLSSIYYRRERAEINRLYNEVIDLCNDTYKEEQVEGEFCIVDEQCVAYF
jgi:regulator of replication initiation timing